MEERQDLISRQAAIDAVENEMCIFYDCDVLEKLEDLPSAQPTLQQTCNNLATDTISRREAIDALESGKDKTAKGDIGGFYNAIVQNDIDKLRNLPPAQPELKKGKWIVHYECPKCGEITKDFTEYCPFCNADMRGEEDE